MAVVVQQHQWRLCSCTTDKFVFPLLHLIFLFYFIFLSIFSLSLQTFPNIANKTVALLRMPKSRYEELRRVAPELAHQSENCLTLNIYVPGSGDLGTEAPYAVFFFIHGDSFAWGSGNLYDGTILSSYGSVIVVTLNYRLGILGKCSVVIRQSNTMVLATPEQTFSIYCGITCNLVALGNVHYST